MYGIDRKRYFWVGLSALAQGLLLGQYLTTSSGIFLALPLILVVPLPFCLWLTQEHWGRRLKRLLGALALVLTLFYLYRLWSVYPTDGELHYLPSQNMDLSRISAVIFLVLPFFQCRIATWSWRVPYSDVFFQLCRNVFLLFQAAIVTLVFWALLLTASLLFDIVGLDFVPHVLFNPLVALPLTSLTIAVSITLALKRPGIDSLGRWILSILAWLLPPFSALSLVFLLCLPFSGLQTLWSTGQASSLMLLLQLATILLANAAWLDGTRSPFSSKAVNTISQLSLLCLPVYTALCLYSLGLRVQQYGLSVDRIQAIFLVLVAGIWGLGYAGTVLFRQWPSAIGRINTLATLIMSVIVIAMNSPLLDPYRLAANNQVARLINGQISASDFDYLYLRFNLGRYGNYALDRLERAQDLPNSADIQKRLEAARTVPPREHWKGVRSNLPPEKQRREILQGAAIYPKGRVLPKHLVERLVRMWDDPSFPLLKKVRHSSSLAFSYQKVTDSENLLLVRPGIGAVLEISSDDLRLLGFFHGNISPDALASQALTVTPSRFKEIWLDGQLCPFVPLISENPMDPEPDLPQEEQAP
ncbi:MAG: DUF4153 domain-containing protein [Fretibacterium sp.]|nr:DUF4153 domain-containing protein [Fretibacterium sp.]